METTSRWVNCVAVVTGASAGIGAATCIELANSGIITIGIARRIDKVQALRFCLTTDKQRNFHAYKCDVSNEAEVKQVFSEIEKKFNGIDILINNAGVFSKSTLIQADNSEDVRRVINTNVIGVVNCTREAVKSMKMKNEAHIIHIGSFFNQNISQNFGIYQASKHAVAALAEQHRQEFSRKKLNIKVTTIIPNAVATELYDNSSYEPPKSVELLAAKEIADVIVFALETPRNVVITELKIRPMNDFN
ncbi:hypothetical protein PVAND_000517 [Polypedilum vanderplanki]|uniref:Uncharacterized protein n=1 Tax=Polypedilum vanderplanki TaxID=319348 RepID=A0A9J6BKI9_POLVA|nr:hypothetical protein PVAND_000517 [Polypedilum vanderplanki]